MKTYTLPVIGLMTLGASAFAAAAPSTGNSLPARDNFSACKWRGDRFKWFNSERDHKNPYIQEFNVSLRMQYGLDWIDPNGEGRVMGEKKGNGRRFNDEWRRFRAGFNMKFLNNFKLNNVWNIGGMDGLESYNAKTNTWDTSDLTYSLYELNLEYKGGPVTYAIGKIKPRITGEYRTSSSAILTIERSMLVNQLRPETNYGFQVNNSDKKDKLGWAAGVWLNGNGGTGTGTFNNRIEPAFNSRDNCFITGTLSYDTINHNIKIWFNYFSIICEGCFCQFDIFTLKNFMGNWYFFDDCSATAIINNKVLIGHCDCCNNYATLSSSFICIIFITVFYSIVCTIY